MLKIINCVYFCVKQKQTNKQFDLFFTLIVLIRNLSYKIPSIIVIRNIIVYILNDVYIYYFPIWKCAGMIVNFSSELFRKLLNLINARLL